jgi:hypothetical protein
MRNRYAQTTPVILNPSRKKKKEPQSGIEGQRKGDGKE